MANMTDLLERELIDGILGVTQYTSPAVIYLGLYTSNPTDTGTAASEVSTTSYERTSLAGAFSASGNGSSLNTAAIGFPVAAEDWGTITHIGFHKSGVKGTNDMIMYGTMFISANVTTGVTFQFLIGDLTISLA